MKKFFSVLPVLLCFILLAGCFGPPSDPPPTKPPALDEVSASPDAEAPASPDADVSSASPADEEKPSPEDASPSPADTGNAPSTADTGDKTGADTGDTPTVSDPPPESSAPNESAPPADSPSPAPTHYTFTVPDGWVSANIENGKSLTNPSIPGAEIRITRYGGEGDQFNSSNFKNCLSRHPEISDKRVAGFFTYRMDGVAFNSFNFTGDIQGREIGGSSFWIRLGDDLLICDGIAPVKNQDLVGDAVSAILYSSKFQ